MEEEKRLDPDALLASIEGEKRGKLTIFLGAIAGVGKTYSMLESAQARLAEGVDVVVGWVETHGRKETEALLEGLPVIPPRYLYYRGKQFAEMDLDALLSRRPALALVDELAHSNVSGSRHSKRYQDVEELLEAGIDVYTTLNIQHLESLNDIVAQITGIRVRETVPDRLLETAEIQLVDVPAEEIIFRLKEGKIYVPDMAQEAMKRFFRPGNINALRELALRYTAQRVDRQVENYRLTHRIPGPWPARDRIMVCVSPSPFSARLIRTASRMAQALDADLLAVYVATPNRLPTEDEDKERLARNFRLAEELGAETLTLFGDDVVAEVLELARKRGVTHLVVGKPLRPKISELIHGSLVEKFIQRSQDLSIHVIPGKAETEEPKHFLKKTKPINWTDYAAAFGLSVLVAILSVLLHPILGLVNIAMLFLLPILFSAAKWGLSAAMFTATVAFLLLDYFFIPPRGSFSVSDLRYITTFIIFILVAFLTGTLATKLRNEVKNCRERGTRLSALYALSRDMAAVTELKPILQGVVERVAENLECPVILFLPVGDHKLEVQASSIHPVNDFLDEKERAVAIWVFKNGRKAGRGTDTLNGARGLYLPLRASDEVQGVLAIFLTEQEHFLPSEQVRLAEAFAGLAALAIHRLKLAEKAREAQLVTESERLRSAIFDSLSHDLRTPLASILGAVTSLLEGDRIFTSEARRELLQTIKQEASHMNRFINNLLDMARLESGVLKLRKEWVDIEDVIGVALSRLGEVLRKRPLKVKLDHDLPLVAADFVLLEQVLVNLLENAVKYSDPGTEIRIEGGREGNHLKISVLNQGPQLPKDELKRIFEKFYRLRPSYVSGTGLGLAICKGVVEAHGGQIWAENHPNGLTISFTLPLSGIGPGEVPPAKVGEDDGSKRSEDIGN